MGQIFDDGMSRGECKMINAAKAEALAALLNHLYIIRCLFLLLVVIFLLFTRNRKYYFFPAINPLMTALVKPSCSMVFNPLMVQPPGVVTLSMAASGCSPVA